MKYFYLHGLGQKPDSWDRTIKETKVSGSSIRLSLAEMSEGKDVLAKNNIKCRTRSTNARINPAPNPGMPVGGIGNGAMQWSTIIQVHKSDFEYAKALIAIYSRI